MDARRTAVIGVDLGTTGCKSMVFGEAGEILAEVYFEYDLISTGDGFIEQDADLWWILVQKAVAESVVRSGLDPADVRALSISSQGISFVPVDTAGNALMRAVSWLDSRVAEQAGQIRRLIPEDEMFLVTGKRISPCYTLPKLMWVRDNLPDIYRLTDKFLMALDYITFKLTGRPVTDYSMASGTLAFNITAGQWDKGILTACGLDSGKLPDVAVAGSLVGLIDPAVAARLGLGCKVKVILGAQDQKCAALGAGIRSGLATVSLGTASAISTISNRPVFDQARRIPCFALGGDRWILESVIGTAGISLKWLKNSLMAALDYAGMDRLAAAAGPGAHGVFFYPHLEGAGSPYWRSDLKGSIHGLSLSSDQADIIRALLEGIAFQIKVNVDLQQEITGTAIEEIRIFGGGSRSDLWCRLIADIAGITVSQLATAEIANYGAAMLAAGNSGIPSPIRKQFLPDPAAGKAYQTIYRRYLEMQDKLLA